MAKIPMTDECSCGHSVCEHLGDQAGPAPCWMPGCDCSDFQISAYEIEIPQE